MQLRHPFAVVLVALALALPLVQLGCKKEEPKDDRLDPSRYAAYFTSYPFGGQRLEWWQLRIAECSAKGTHPNPSLCDATITRAKANGLSVEETGAAPVVKPGPKLAAELIRRLEVK